ncbi:glycosyltransferase [Leclercia adecarboxylata]|jgi:glycosyltransferase involved in cell wall biosynthesis|uniref:glycosyltransferase n=1 Tax=Leclercia TaxID=83654 RepID=UPI000CDCD5EE|nr:MULTISPECIES: glycosyltransferase [Leclercia]AUY40870.1 glycosyl transferase family 1 [Leclercia sp. LSNIH3]MDQ2127085.1 glycosyltransferase [Leclercia adecarboxylata]MDV7055697.1 glycosyltransferase [Leclercia adecarboxylata]POW72479.1 glycosyl transferase family 1 [Leclercia sp. LSNIH4]
MKILFVITGLGLGGAEKQVCLLADKLTACHHEVKIISLTSASNNKVLPNNSNIEVISIDMKKSVWGLFKGVMTVRKIIRSFLPDIVHGHMFHANIISRLATIGKQKQIGVISTAHNKNEGGSLRMLAYRLTDWLCDKCTNVSKEALEEFIRLRAFRSEKSMTMYNGIDVEKFRFNSTLRENIRDGLNIKENEVLMLAVGRLTEAKDYPNLLNALVLLPSHFKLAILGDGHLHAYISRMITELNLETRVTLLGTRDDVAPYYSACDIFVLASRWEGFGLVVAEAMSCERLVVGTDSGGVREVIGDGNFLVPISDATRLADKIKSLMLESPENKKKIASRNRQYIVNNFSIESVITQWQDVYQSYRETK